MRDRLHVRLCGMRRVFVHDLGGKVVKADHNAEKRFAQLGVVLNHRDQSLIRVVQLWVTNPVLTEQRIDAGLIDRIVVYKIDRLTRSLSDFSHIVDRLEAKGASFVSVTQSFNTATSMGRLTLNMLLSFAQFEREVTAERIRDKIAASKKKGLWMGGLSPLGYDPHPDKTIRGLVINECEAQTVRRLFALYARKGNLSRVREDAAREGLRSKRRVYPCGKVTGDKPLSNGQIHHMLTNPVYAGKIRYKGQIYDGQHEAMIDQALWDDVQQKLKSASVRQRGGSNERDNATWLTGKMFDETGDRLTPSHSKKADRVLRYYVSNRLITKGKDPTGWRVPAEKIQDAVLGLDCDHLRRITDTGALIACQDIDDMRAVQKTASDLMVRMEQGINKDLAAALIDRIDLSRSQIEIRLDGHALAKQLQIAVEYIAPNAVKIDAPLVMGRRGVEQKIILGDRLPGTDPKLQYLLVRAHHWVNELKSGRPLGALAKSEDLSTAYIRTRLPLAFLAPDLQRRILTGDHPANWCIEHFRKYGVQDCWAAQRDIFLPDA